MRIFKVHGPPTIFTVPRLFVAAPLGAGLTVTLDAAQIHYLVSVLRMAPGDSVLGCLNGADGEWKASPRRGGQAEYRPSG